MSTSTTDVGCHVWRGIPVKVNQRSRLFPLWSPYELYADIKNNKSRFDVFHVEGMKSMDCILPSLMKAKLPLLVTLHYHPIASTQLLNVIKRLAESIIFRKVLREAKHVITVSEITKELIVKHFCSCLRNKITVIPNGINLEVINRVKPFKVNKKIILYVGRLEQYKNLGYALAAMKYLHEKFLFYIIGEGSYKGKLEFLAKKLNVTSRVKFLGSLPDSQMYRWMKTCSVFVYLSDVEAFGISVLEALAAGAPCIVNAKFGLRELSQKFRESILPVNVKEMGIRSLAKTIQEVSDMKIRVDLRTYDWDNIAKKKEHVYSMVLSK